MSPKGKKLRCPGCGGTLGEACVEATYGRVVVVDQCGRCGGVWFDRWELYFLRPDALRGLARLDEGRLFAGNPGTMPADDGSDPWDCPKCNGILEDFNDPMIPPDALIRTCPRCRGLWLNRGSIAGYAAHREALHEKNYPGPAGDGRTGRSGEAEEGPANGAAPARGADENRRLEVLKRLQMELDTRAIAEPGPGLSALDSDYTAGEFARDAGILALQSLARLLFKF